MSNRTAVIKVDDYGHIKPVTQIDTNEIILTRVIIGKTIYDKPIPMIPGHIFINVTVNLENNLSVSTGIYITTNHTVTNDGDICNCELIQLSPIDAYKQLGGEYMILINSVVDLAMSYANHRAAYLAINNGLTITDCNKEV